MIIHLATDHAGFEHKEYLKEYLLEEHFEIVDHGASVLEEGDDYPDYVTPCAEAVVRNENALGIIFGYSGQGEAMCANRVNGARAVVYYGGLTDILLLSREHNDANVLSIGAHFVSKEDMIQAVKIWLGTPFSGDERHVRRLAKF